MSETALQQPDDDSIAPPEAEGARVFTGIETEPLDPDPAEHRQPIQQAFWNTPLLEPGSYSGVPDRFVRESGRVATRQELAKAQARELRGRVSSARANGWTRNSRQKYRRILETDRQCQNRFADLHTVMLSLRQSPIVSGEWVPPLALLSELSEVVREYVIPACRRAIPHEFEYAVVLAGTDKWATPHAHVYLWIDGPVTSGDFAHIVEGYTDRCTYAPDSGRGNEPGEAITVRSPEEQQLAEESAHPHNERGKPTTGAVYVARQIPNLPTPDDADDADLIHGAVCDTFQSSAVWFSRGCWSYGDPEPVVNSDSLSRERFPDSPQSENPGESGSPLSSPKGVASPNPPTRGYRDSSRENRTEIQTPTTGPCTLGVG